MLVPTIGVIGSVLLLCVGTAILFRLTEFHKLSMNNWWHNNMVNVPYAVLNLSAALLSIIAIGQIR